MEEIITKEEFEKRIGEVLNHMGFLNPKSKEYKECMDTYKDLVHGYKTLYGEPSHVEEVKKTFRERAVDVFLTPQVFCTTIATVGSIAVIFGQTMMIGNKEATGSFSNSRLMTNLLQKAQFRTQ